MRRNLSLSTGLLIAIATLTLPAGADESSKSASAAASTAVSAPAPAEKSGHERSQLFMRQKLTYSQGILEGLVLEKFDLVATNATLLRNMNLTNAFFVLGNPSYKTEIANFQSSVDNLSKNANNKELWPAYEAYNQVAQQCVHCHQQFRRDQFVRHAQQDSSK